MYSFFVLGQVPGTDITITFTMWMEAGAALLTITILVTLIWKRINRFQPMPPTIGNETLPTFTDLAA